MIEILARAGMTERKHYIVNYLLSSRPVAVSLAKFLADDHKQWVMAGTTSGSIYTYDCDSRVEKHVLRGHSKSIKSLAIHGTESLVLSASIMDAKILLWEYAGEEWHLIKTFDTKSQCLMQVAFDPNDTNLFASAQDKTIKVCSFVRVYINFLSHAVVWTFVLPALMISC
jgi:coatomer subunit beta'